MKVHHITRLSVRLSSQRLVRQAGQLPAPIHVGAHGGNARF